MGWDSNPRDPFRPAGFQDRCLQPLGHPSVAGTSKGCRRDRLVSAFVLPPVVDRDRGIAGAMTTRLMHAMGWRIPEKGLAVMSPFQAIFRVFEAPPWQRLRQPVSEVLTHFLTRYFSSITLKSYNFPGIVTRSGVYRCRDSLHFSAPNPVRDVKALV